MPSTNRDWERNTVTFDYLEKHASDEPMSMVEWLQSFGVIPEGVEFRRRNAIPKTINPEAIPAGYLAEVALSWDDEGFTSSEAFLFMLQAETNGTSQHDSISETLESLGREALGR